MTKNTEQEETWQDLITRIKTPENETGLTELIQDIGAFGRVAKMKLPIDPTPLQKKAAALGIEADDAVQLIAMGIVHAMEVKPITPRER